MTRVRIAAALFAIGAVACVKRFPADAGPNRMVLSGVPVSFGRPGPIEAGTQVRWDFGDGVSGEGSPAVHAFSRPGEFRVVVTVSDADGLRRRGEAVIQVERRMPLAAVPPTASLAVGFNQFIARLPSYLTLADRFGGSLAARGALKKAEDRLGFDIARPDAATAAGIDPDKGIALATLEEEPAATYWLVGLADEAVARATVQRVAEQFPTDEGPDGSKRVRTDFGDVYYLFDRGYLILGTLPAKTAPRGFPVFRNAPPDGLLSAPAYRRGRARVTGNDVQAWASPSIIFEGTSVGQNATARALRAGAVGFILAGTLGERLSEFDIWFGVDGDAGRTALREVFASEHPRTGGEDLFARAPAGAVGYLSAAAAPERLAELVIGAPTDPRREKMAQDLREATGLDLESLLLLFDGDLKAAGYFKPGEFYRAMFSQREPMLAAGLIVAMGVRDGPSAEKELLRAIAARGFRPDVSRGPRGVTYEVELDGARGAAAIRGKSLLLALSAELLEQTLSESETQARLEKELRAVVPASAFSPGHQFLYVDVARAVDEIRSPPDLAGIDPIHVALMRAVVGHYLETIGPIQDGLVDVWNENEGIGGRVRIRLR